MAAQQRVVVADAEDPAGALHIGALREGLQPVDHVVDGIDVPIGRGEQVGAHCLGAELLGMGVPVDEAGHQRLAGKVLDDGSVALPLEGIDLRTDEDDLAVVDDDRFGDCGRRSLHGEDGAAGDDQIGPSVGAGVGDCGRLAAGSEGKRGNTSAGRRRETGS